MLSSALAVAGLLTSRSGPRCQGPPAVLSAESMAEANRRAAERKAEKERRKAEREAKKGGRRAAAATA